MTTEQQIRLPTLHPDFEMDVVKVTRINRFNVLARVKPFHDGLSLAKGRTMEELYRNVDVGCEAVFVTTNDGEDIAVVVERLKTVNIGGREYKVLKRFLRAVSPDYQQRGIGTALTDEPIGRLEPHAITGRTPNPYVFRSDELSPRVGGIHPIHRLHTPETRLLLVATLDSKSIAETDLRTGVCKGVYPFGENRLFSLEGASERVLEIHARMIELGANLEEGDGLRYLELVKHDPRGRERFGPAG